MKKSDAHFGSRYIEQAYVNNLEAILYIVLKQFDEAEKSLEKSLDYAELGLSDKVKIKVLNNYAVLCRLEEKNDEAIAYLKKVGEVSYLNDSEKTMLFLRLFHHLRDSLFLQLYLPTDCKKREDSHCQDLHKPQKYCFHQL